MQAGTSLATKGKLRYIAIRLASSWELSGRGVALLAWVITAVDHMLKASACVEVLLLRPACSVNEARKREVCTVAPMWSLSSEAGVGQ
jgi:hypothetical protein